MSKAPLSSPKPRDYFILAALVLIWGTTFLLVKIALMEIEPGLVAAARIIFGAAVLVPFVIITGRKWPRGKDQITATILVGILSSVLPFSLLAWAQQVVPSGVAGVYMSAAPLILLPLAHFFSPGERMTPQSVIGFIIGFGGVLMLMGWEALSALGSANSLAQLACLGASSCYAISSIIVRRAPAMDPISLSAGALLAGSFVILPFGLSALPTGPISGTKILVLVLVGTVSTACAFVLRVMLINSAGSVFMSSAGYLIPITALCVGALFGNETIYLGDLFAVSLILGGLAIAQRIGMKKT